MLLAFIFTFFLGAFLLALWLYQRISYKPEGYRCFFIFVGASLAERIYTSTISPGYYASEWWKFTGVMILLVIFALLLVTWFWMMRFLLKLLHLV